MLFMRYKVPLICLLILALLSAGCTTTSELSGAIPQGKVTPTPAPEYGSVTISSDPRGADVYLDGERKGTTTLTLTNIPAGKHNLVVTMPGYVESDSTITVAADKATTVKKTLKKAKPNVNVNVDKANLVYQGRDPLIEITGTVENRGAASAYELKLIIAMTPKDSDYKNLKVVKTITIGSLEPGAQKNYVAHIQLMRNIDYKGTIRPECRFEGDLLKGSTKSF